MTRTSAFCAAVLACAAWACSGSTASPADAGVAGDGGTGAEAGATYTLENVCASIPAKVCALRKPCCEQTSTYDEAGCIAHEKAQCEKDVADTKAGKATFHPELIDPCIAKLEPVFKKDCTLTFDGLFSIIDELRVCNVFDGSLAEGATCSRDSECKHATKQGELTSCEDDTRRCQTTRVLADGADCMLGDGATGYCNAGLYCDADLSKPAPFTGTCKKATPVGQTCDATKRPVSLECGLGKFCEPTTGKCTVGNAGGTPCIAAEEYKCASFSCEAGKCRGASPLVKEVDCKGP